MTTPVIQIESMAKSYVLGGETVKALRDVSLDIYEGDFISIMGPSGSGKSTFMNMIGCLDRPESGHYFLAGAEVDKLNDDQLAEIRNEKIGFIFQNFNLLMKLTAVENIELPLLYKGIGTKERREIANACLEQVGLLDRAHHMPNQLSGGQQQRVAIARALAGQPPILLADEPTGALDSKTSKEILQLMVELHRQGHTIVLITHDLEVAKHASRIVSIQDGQLFENGGDSLEPDAIRQDGAAQYQEQ